MELTFADAKDFVKVGQPVLTVRQPYALFLVNGSKEYEFRSTGLPRKYFFNEWILIHAGTQLKKEIVAMNEESYNYQVQLAKDDGLFSCIIGAVKFCDSIPNGGNGCPVINADYKFAWRVFKAVRFREPVRNIKGQLGIWKFKQQNCNYERKTNRPSAGR